ncbi:MAG: hypothetical protein KF729_22075 [Sandaracinaceae bacterium]|nr:hypothetical protein [Sandaracinaceae bacterium]
MSAVIARAIVAGALSLGLAGAALAQEAPPPERLRADARAALAAGRIEDAYGLMRGAAERSRAASDWRELAEIADRLRLDELALSAYETYLARAPDAADRAEIEGRVRVLRRIVQGGRYAAPPDGSTVPELIDLEGRPVERAAPRNFLVDWDGRPRTARASGLLTLVEWDGAAPAPALDAAHVAREGGLGRALATP